MKEWGIRTRVLFLALVPLTVTVVLLAYHFIHTRLYELDHALINRGQAIARQLAPACEYGLLSGNVPILQTLARAALLEADVVSVAITDIHDHLLAGASAPRKAESSASGLVAVASAADGVTYTSADGKYIFRAPVFRSRVVIDEPLDHDGKNAPPGARPAAEQVGWVTVALSQRATRALQDQVLVEGLFITALGLLATVLIALAMARGVTWPIRALTRSVERIKNGELTERVATGAGGELGILERGINAMAEALERAREEEKKRTDDALFQEKVRAQVTLASIGDGVITTDEAGRIVYMNVIAEQYTGVRADQAQGKPLDEVFRLIDETTDRALRYPLHYCLHDGRVIRHDSHHLLVNSEGAKLEIQDTAAPIRDRDDTILGAVVVFRDVTEIQHMVRRMAFLASHDPLTGLINRREFESRLHQVLEGALSEGQEHALCYIDLDQFKIVNDTSGHVAGDELLKQLAHHLSREIRSSDTLARLGGDEFGVILESCAIDKALAIAEMLRGSVTDFRFIWQGRTYQVGASIGLVPINHDSGTITELLSAADSACYVAKDRGRNRIHVYQPDDAALSQRSSEMLWVNRLRHGLDNDSFELYAQAIEPLGEGRSGSEAFYEILVRIQDHDLVLPAVFMPAAERYHLMPAIDRWVIDSALSLIRDASARRDAVATQFAINLSGQSLSDDSFLPYVLARFEESGVAPSRICFEITETAAIANLTRARAFIARLKELGCRFALDDFGSGLSSFGYLKSLPVDYLKIAGEFIRDMAEDPVDHAMVDAINQIGHVMGLITIAESVEDAAVIEKLRQLGVNYMQGLAIDRPRRLFEVLQLSETQWRAVRGGFVRAARG